MESQEISMWISRHSSANENLAATLFSIQVAYYIELVFITLFLKNGVHYFLI